MAAPASTANLGAGFDVFGMALDGRHDTVRVAESGDHSITITADGGVPSDPGRNTAGIVAGAMRDEFGTGGAHITIRKGVPAGYGMGSSAASAAAAAVAFNELFGLGLDRTALVRYAGYGERASAGSIHYDNVAASVCGGFVIVRTDPLGVTALRPPEGNWPSAWPCRTPRSPRARPGCRGGWSPRAYPWAASPPTWPRRPPWWPG